MNSRTIGIPILVLLLAPAGAYANDPMAGWLHQQQMAYQKARTVKGGVPRSTGTLLSPGKVLARKKQPNRKAPPKEEATATETTTTTPDATAKETKAKEMTARSAGSTPSTAYALGKMVRRLIQAFHSGPKPAKVVSKQTAPTPRPEKVAEAPKGFAPPARLVGGKVASPASLFLLRQARLITVADYQAESLRFLGAR